MISNVLYQLAAAALTHERVRVEFVDQIPNHTMGQVYKSNGWFIIQIVKGGSYKGELPIFLHEVAHIQLLRDQFVDLGDKTPEQLKGDRPASGSTQGDENDELEAEQLAGLWLNMGAIHAWRFEGSRTEAILKALINWEKLTERTS